MTTRKLTKTLAAHLYWGRDEEAQRVLDDMINDATIMWIYLEEILAAGGEVRYIDGVFHVRDHLKISTGVSKSLYDAITMAKDRENEWKAEEP